MKSRQTSSLVSPVARPTDSKDFAAKTKASVDTIRVIPAKRVPDPGFAWLTEQDKSSNNLKCYTSVT
jgi:hypothetical protein